MAREDFERDMHDYLRTRKKAKSPKEFFQNILRSFKPKQPQPLPSDLEVYTDEPVRRQSAPAISEDVIRERMRADDAVDDMKEMARITLKMIKDLPEETIGKYKQAPEFEKLKALLKKHELIK